jgi:2-keto-3-deoxy-L-fuconate dehydrogenase
VTGELDGLRALVTGGGSGIGLATANLLQERGAHVAVLDIAPGSAGGFVHLQADVCDAASVGRAVADAVAALGGLDALINNAGVGLVGTVEDATDEQWHHVFDVNVVGIARVTRAALPALRRSTQAAIVNVSSIAAATGLPARAVYGATKGAVHALTLAMAADLIGDGIRVNCVSPGTTDTPWIARLLDATEYPVTERARLRSRQPHGRFVTPAEVAAAIAFLAGPGSASTTATSLAVDGGLSGLQLPPKEV